jgi:predicted dehydrogenase
MVIRIGMIGLSASDDAWSVMAHVKPLLQEPLLSQYKITAIATSSVESSAASAKRWGVPVDKAYVTAEDIANDPDVDLVVVNVKLPHHRDLAMPVLKVGKDVFVEWPLATTLDEVAELQAAARKSGARTFVGLQARTAPFIQKACNFLWNLLQPSNPSRYRRRRLLNLAGWEELFQAPLWESITYCSTSLQNTTMNIIKRPVSKTWTSGE